MNETNNTDYDYDSRIQNYTWRESRLLDDGSIYIPERIIPIPKSISKQAQEWMRTDHALAKGKAGLSIEQIRQNRDQIWKVVISRARGIYPVEISDITIGDIECLVVEPESGVVEKNKDKVIINIFPGGGVTGHGNTVDAIPIANLLGIKVICPQYRLMPEHPFPSAIDDLEMTYKNLLQSYQSENIGIYGASQGAYYTFQLCSRLMFNDLPLPGAIASWGGGGEIAEGGHVADNDTRITNHDLDPIVRNSSSTSFLRSEGRLDVKDPLVSPIYADLTKFPPALLAAGSRDHALSSTIMMHTALKKAGNEAELFVFEGMHHLFSAMHDLPEAKDLHKFTALFFKKYLPL